MNRGSMGSSTTTTRRPRIEVDSHNSDAFRNQAELDALTDGVGGTHGIGIILTTFARLVELFGAPTRGSDDGKTRVEWVLRLVASDLNDRESFVITIYDWKSNKPVGEVLEWSVGGKTPLALQYLEVFLGSVDTKWSRRTF